MANTKTLEAIRARIDGDFDNQVLQKFGFLSADIATDILTIVAATQLPDKPQNLHVFRVIYLPHTATLPARVKITSERFKQSIIVSYHADEFKDCRDAQEIAVKHLTTLGYTIVSIGEGWGCMYVISDTFEPLNKQS